MSPEIAEPENTLAVRHNDRAYVVLGPIFNDLVHVTLVVDADEQASRSSVNQSELLTRQTNRRGVDQGHHLLDILAEETIEEPLVSVLLGKEKKNYSLMKLFISFSGPQIQSNIKILRPFVDHSNNLFRFIYSIHQTI